MNPIPEVSECEPHIHHHADDSHDDDAAAAPAPAPAPRTFIPDEFIDPRTGRPGAVGLYDPANEMDACGVGFIADLNRRQTRDTVLHAITMLERMDHRGACGCEKNTGDGAGVLLSIPQDFMRRVMRESVFSHIPLPGEYGVGMLFLPHDKNQRDLAKTWIAETAKAIDLEVLGWRDVPTANGTIGPSALSTEPKVEQVFVTSKAGGITQDQLEKKCYILRKITGNRFDLHEDFALTPHWCSLSSRTVIYKGQLLSYQIYQYFPDLLYPDFKTDMAVVHSRFSTNTFPSWDRAHPFSCVAHNGEINTLRGNVNWAKSREGQMKCEGLDVTDEQLKQLFPLIGPNLSDSGCFNSVLELLVMSGRSIPEAMSMMIPEAWQNDPNIDEVKRAYYEYNSALMEPWDGPALVVFTDGKYLGSSLDRNGLRPGRIIETTDGIVMLSSETGTVDVPPERIKRRSRLRPGQMFLVNLEEGRVIEDSEIKGKMITANPYKEWVSNQVIDMDALVGDYRKHQKPSDLLPKMTLDELVPTLTMFGWTQEGLEMLLLPMCRDGMEALGSMGNDSPLAVLSEYHNSVFNYLKQLFAQVTNPPLDSTRESVVMSLESLVGPEGDLTTVTEAQCRKIRLRSPILQEQQFQALKLMKEWGHATLDATFPVTAAENGLKQGLDRVCNEAAAAVEKGINVIILSDAKASPDRVPIPSALVVGAVHHHMVRLCQRTRIVLVLDSGEAREVHHMCVLIGYGADAIYPREAFRTIEAIEEIETKTASNKFVKALHKGILKIMAKMGISTLQSYRGAQIFEAVGLSADIVDRCFAGTASRMGGETLHSFSQSCVDYHKQVFVSIDKATSKMLRNPGQYHYRSNEGSEVHLNDPAAIAKLQEAARTDSPAAYKEYAMLVNDLNRRCTIRGQLRFKENPAGKIDISEVEPASEIVKRFCTGAMSYGSISLEAHSTLAIAMNRLKGKSNTGEGGEALDRLLPDEDGTPSPARSAIKQIASGRFGVTSLYLTNADELQIKMAQGAKPGEGGELPGHKVVGEIAKVRHSTPGVGLISPPPHHDIYSIEDLKQLIFDLKNANPAARVSVKLVSEVGVGVVASGVAKGMADHILISGHDGGTGASRWSGIKHAGLPWELGLAETQQTLVMNDLRGRVVVQTDGQLKTGRDVAVAALLGAEEFGFATAPLIAMGCIMMRKCHLNTCPVGIATQDPELRRKFAGTPEHVQNFLFLLAEEVREHMAKMGFRTIQEMVGRVDMLEADPTIVRGKEKELDFAKILLPSATLRPDAAQYNVVPQDHGLDEILDRKLVELCMPCLEDRDIAVSEQVTVSNTDRAVGCFLSHTVTKAYGATPLPPDTIHVRFTGSAGQSFGCWLTSGIFFEISGDCNDYVGKGLCGGRIVVYPPSGTSFLSEENVIIGNVALYGATSGSLFVRGRAGERFCVRNSGAKAVVEGVGDHCCEYMTGGRTVVLGDFGRNFAAGMSGGVAYVYDPDNKLQTLVNKEMVELEHVEPKSSAARELKSLVQQHRRYTNSAVASKMLTNWDLALTKFVQVMPTEYRRAMAELRASQAALAKNRRRTATAPSSRGSLPGADDDGRRVSINEPGPGDIEEVGVKPLPIAKPSKIAKPIKKRGFIEYGREVLGYRDPKTRVGDWKEIAAVSDEAPKLLKTQAARCMDCGVPFCHQKKSGCPLGNRIPEWNDLVYKGDYKAALKSLLATNNFPEFTGRVCPAPCEGACVLGIIENPVSIKQIECTIIDRGFEEGWIVPEPPAVRTKRTVCIVGSGPAGMAAADQLNKAGHTVTVLERADRIGGLMMYGVPNMKCDKVDIVQRRVDLMAKEGVVFKTNVEVGVDTTLDKLRKSFDAVLLATGSTVPRDLPIPGRQLGGVHFAMDFLRTNTKSLLDSEHKDKKFIDVKGKKVVVIGGGDTGNDCIGTSVRLGAASVVNLELMPRNPETRANDNPWPTFPRVFKIDYGHEEVSAIYGGDPREYQVLSKEFVDDGKGNVKGIRLVNVVWAKDDNGRWNMSEVEGSERTIEADCVLLALGFVGPEKKLIEGMPVQTTNRGNFQADEKAFETTERGLFAAGDCRRGQSLVVWAIAEGRAAAASINNYLSKSVAA
eukprot:m.61807 g.61807  ORF g.61807 m.61807 type:complete len:2109 (+) comp8048_c0_seq1:137-6463(+)